MHPVCSNYSRSSRIFRSARITVVQRWKDLRAEAVPLKYRIVPR